MAAGHRVGQEYRCQWCRSPLASSFATCPNAACDRPPGWRLDQHVTGGFRGKSRCYALTPLGWQTAGYTRTDRGWERRSEGV